MTAREYLNAVTHSRVDVLQLLLEALRRLKIDYCVIGGLAVNAYCEPVVSLDMDIVVVLQEVDALCAALRKKFKITRYPHSINLSSAKSDLRVQIQIDPRYQDFISAAVPRTVLGYRMQVAAPENLLQGKIWAWEDTARRVSKRHKDLSDIARLLEVYPGLKKSLPPVLRAKMA